MHGGPHRFTVFEGIDGAGKTTLRNLVWDRLLERGYPVIAMGQHSWLQPASAVDLVHLRTAAETPRIRTEAERAAIARAYLEDKKLHSKRNIERALAHASVLADRYFLSDVVYLSTLYDLDPGRLLRSYRRAAVIVPDLVVYVVATAGLAYERVLQRNRPTRHYEAPIPLAVLEVAYEKVLNESTAQGGPELITIDNDGATPLPVLAEIVVEAHLAAM